MTSSSPPPQPLAATTMQNSNDQRALFATAFWRDNVALVQLLGLCPLLAVTTSVVNGLALGLASAAVLVVSNAIVATTRRALLPAARVPLYLLIVRAYRLSKPVTLRNTPAYAGCKSWVPLTAGVEEEGSRPAMEQGKFETITERVEAALR